uniref:Uncharacterized protein n=1 Tax=Hanusia phi TaxID=3032 RepID=A0A7S0H7T3_9CRYP|mmetsp:Transcript_14077/g.32460  ORF Transcript_14077/g.32460 Transcript_14077/m.32460 type:complete len:268 (+) Transcript_14077:53-856(+)
MTETLSKKEQLFFEYKQKGNDAVKSLDWQNAIRHYTEALHNAPSHYYQPEGQAALVLSNRSMANLKAGSLDKAMEDACECVRLCPRWSKAYFRRAEALRYQGRWQEASDDYRRGSEQDPHDEHLSMMRKEAEEKAKLASSPVEFLLAWEEQAGLDHRTVWPARCGVCGFVLCVMLAMAQPQELSNGVASLMLALAGAALGAGVGLCVSMIKAARRREKLAAPLVEAVRSGEDRGVPSSAAEGQDHADGKRRSRIKGLSKSLKNRAGR